MPISTTRKQLSDLKYPPLASESPVTVGITGL